MNTKKASPSPTRKFSVGPGNGGAADPSLPDGDDDQHELQRCTRLRCHFSAIGYDYQLACRYARLFADAGFTAAVSSSDDTEDADDNGEEILAILSNLSAAELTSVGIVSVGEQRTFWFRCKRAADPQSRPRRSSSISPHDQSAMKPCRHRSPHDSHR